MVRWYNTADYRDEWYEGGYHDVFYHKYNMEIRKRLLKEIGRGFDVPVHFRYVDSEPDRGDFSIKVFFIRITIESVVEDSKKPIVFKVVQDLLNEIGFDLSKASIYPNLHQSNDCDIYITYPESVKKCVESAEKIFGRELTLYGEKYSEGEIFGWR